MFAACMKGLTDVTSLRAGTKSVGESRGYAVVLQSTEFLCKHSDLQLLCGRSTEERVRDRHT